MKHRNMVGPQIRKLRYVRCWSQNVLAAKLQILGWDIDRVAVAKIESRLVHVEDYELLYFTKVFNVGLAELYPKIDAQRRIHEVLTELMQRRAPPGRFC
jgi:transcriptional regulator with XRE-family HTH domain